MPWKYVLEVADWKHPSLADELGKQLAGELPPANSPEDEKPPVEELNKIGALLAQAIGMGETYGLSGIGAIELVSTKAGEMASVHTEHGTFAQHADPLLVEKMTAMRKLAARKVVAAPPPKAVPKTPPPFAGAPAAPRRE